MVRSLGLVGLAVLGMVMFTLRDQPTHPPVSVDISATVTTARTNADFPVLAMTSMPKDWYANFADLTPISGEAGRWTFHIGYVTDDAQYFGVDASDGADEQRQAAAKPLRTETVAGLAFDVHADGESEKWIHADPEGYTITLTGSGSPEQWRSFVDALSATGPTVS